MGPRIRVEDLELEGVGSFQSLLRVSSHPLLIWRNIRRLFTLVVKTRRQFVLRHDCAKTSWTDNISSGARCRPSKEEVLPPRLFAERSLPLVNNPRLVCRQMEQTSAHLPPPVLFFSFLFEVLFLLFPLTHSVKKTSIAARFLSSSGLFTTFTVVKSPGKTVGLVKKQFHTSAPI